MEISVSIRFLAGIYYDNSHVRMITMKYMVCQLELEWFRSQSKPVTNILNARLVKNALALLATFISITNRIQSNWIIWITWRVTVKNGKNNCIGIRSRHFVSSLICFIENTVDWTITVRPCENNFHNHNTVVIGSLLFPILLPRNPRKICSCTSLFGFYLKRTHNRTII